KDGEYEALVECKGTVSQNPQEAYASQLLNHLLAAKSNGEPRGILVINHDRKRDALSRSLPYEDAPHILEYDIAIVPTVELFKLIRAVQNGEKTTEEARALLKTRGRFQYPLPEASPGSTAESGK
ncbi:MAG TPA: hypothetical protein VMV50_02765, partial [Candidatus Paceibacterota bacterium]|nr:hypothetical protein [Candidatus Paceibacterota bacterium]